MEINQETEVPISLIGNQKWTYPYLLKACEWCYGCVDKCSYFTIEFTLKVPYFSYGVGDNSLWNSQCTKNKKMENNELFLCCRRYFFIEFPLNGKWKIESPIRDLFPLYEYRKNQK